VKIVKTASGKQNIRLSRNEWQSIGEMAGWIKTAKQYEVSYSVGFSPEIKKKTVFVNPSKLPEGVTEKDFIAKQLSKKEGKNVIIVKSIPIGSVSKKHGPNVKDLQKARGEEMRKERQRRKDREDHENWLKQKLQENALPEDIDEGRALPLIEEFEQVKGLGEEEKELSLIEQLERKKKNI